LASDDPDAGVPRVERFIDRYGIDLLINNAGVTAFGRFDAIAVDEQLAMIQLNVVAPLRLTHTAADVMRRRGGGVIVNVASVGAFRPMPFMATYAATKTFALMHGLALRYELAPLGVRVITVCPGPMDTEGLRETSVSGPLSRAPRDNPALVARRVVGAL